MELNKIYNMDCLEGMKGIKSNSIDLVLTDPPYGVSRNSNFHTMKRMGTDFGEWDKNFHNEYWLKEVSRILKNGGSLIAFNDFKKATDIYNICSVEGLEYKDTLIWHKTNPMPRNRDRRYVPNIEMAQWYVKPKGKWVFNRQNEKYESCIMSCPSETGGRTKRYHPTQKPIKLLSELIKIHSNENDIVLDCFGGSGSTAIACMDTKRNFISYELDKEYFDIACKRIDEHKIKG